MNTQLENLVIVVGHAAFSTKITPEELPDRPFELSADPWVLQWFQKGEPHYYGEHMAAGIRAASEDPASLLISSGGFTRDEAVGGRYDWSEANTYLTAAERSGWFRTADEETRTYDTPDGSTLHIPMKTIVTPEGYEHTVASNEYARDSIENVLGDVATFIALSGRAPKQVTVVGWKFKEDRFRQHAEAIGIPAERFNYVGVNNPADYDLAGALKGEADSLRLFSTDILGRNYEGKFDDPGYPGSLAQKRDERDPLHRGNPHWSMLQIIRDAFTAVA